MSKPSVVFSPEEHSQIVEMVKQGLTIQSIAYATGHSSRSVQDHLKEHRIKTAHTKLREKMKQERAEREAKAKDQKPKTRDRKITVPMTIEPPREIFDPTPSDFKMRLITLEEKGPYDCSWIIGDPKKYYRYCGNSTLGTGAPYCEYHKGISLSKQFQPSTRPYVPVNHK